MQSLGDGSQCVSISIVSRELAVPLHLLLHSCIQYIKILLCKEEKMITLRLLEYLFVPSVCNVGKCLVVVTRSEHL